MFGSTTFGSTPAATPAFGQSTTPSFGFGQSAPASTPAFGQPAATSPFGQPAAAPSPFGQPTTAAPFGQPAAATPFGQPAAPAAAPTAFGQPAAPSAFGQPAAASPFGQPVASSPTSMFGQPAAATNTAFGQTAPATNQFGAPAAAPAAPTGAIPNGGPYAAGHHLNSANPNTQHHAITMPPDADSVSSITFSPTSNHFVASFWDRRIGLWEAGKANATTAASNPKSVFDHHKFPVLCTAFSTDGNSVFSGSCDNTVQHVNLATNAVEEIGRHDKPICAVKSFASQPTNIVTGSWDKQLKVWDIRTKQAAFTIPLPQPVYCMDVQDMTIVTGLAERVMGIIDMRQPTNVQTRASPLKQQTKSIAMFPQGGGYVVGSTHGRIGICHLPTSPKDFQFVGHRNKQNHMCYPVNCLAFHPTATGQAHTSTTGKPGQGRAFASTGGDGFLKVWDKDERQNLFSNEKCPQPVTAAAFNGDGTIMAYSVCYDWSQGVPNKSAPTFNSASSKIYLRVVNQADLTKKNR